MPRPLRIEYNGAWYHVMNRGTNHQSIFYSENHKNMFCLLLNEIAERFYVETHAYCLMDNHYHIILHTPLGNLGKAMRHLDGVYTQRFNRIEKRDGPLFRGRYKAILVENNSYLLQLSRYIHLNPVTAKLCHSPKDFFWSSYHAYAGIKDREKWLHTDFILNYMNGNKEKYNDYVTGGIPNFINDFYNRKQLPAILGSDSFIKNSLSLLHQNQVKSSKHEINRTKIVIQPQKILDKVFNYFQIDYYLLTRSTRGQINLPKHICIYLLRQLSQLSHQKIADFMNCTEANIATSLKRFRKLLIQDKNCQVYINDLTNILSSMALVNS